MYKFFRFDLKFNIRRLPLVYSLGDVSSIQDNFPPEHGDIGRTHLPILPPISEVIPQNGDNLEGYFVENSPALMVAIKEFLTAMIFQLQSHHPIGYHQENELVRSYTEARREFMNRIGIRLIQVIEQERRLGLYNLFWLVISKHLVTLFDRVITETDDKKIKSRITMISIISQTLQETIHLVTRYFQNNDAQKRRHFPHIDEIIPSHLGRTWNYEFSRAIITDQLHLLFPDMSSTNPLDYAQAVFIEQNEKYHITYTDFVNMYSGVRTYIEKQVYRRDPVFCEMIANVLKVPFETVTHIPIETLIFHPTIISLFAAEIQQLPVKNLSRKKLFFKSRPAQLRNIFGEGSWEFAMNDYLTFVRDLRRSEIVAFFRNRIVFVTKNHQTATVADRISYQFDKGRIINDLRQVTLMVLDLRDFTELSAGDISDQELKEYLYTFFDPIVNIINHFEGTIKTYSGDGILASFGTRDHALNAVRAAVEIQKFFTMLKHEGKTAFTEMGIGVHTGLVEETYFFPDSETSSHNTVVGLTANIAGRLSSGKTEKTPALDIQTVMALHEYIQAHGHASNLDLFQAIDVMQQKTTRLLAKEAHNSTLAVTVIGGILNNNGIAISNTTFKNIGSLRSLQELETQGNVKYTFFDDQLQEKILFVKSGDAVFKGIKGKFPVWGVYLYRNLDF